MAQTMIFEGKNLDDWFKLPMVKCFFKHNRKPILILCVGFLWYTLHIGDALEIDEDGSFEIIRKNKRL